jgi:hypothetical protein
MHNESNVSRRGFLARASTIGVAGLVGAATPALDALAAPRAERGRLDLARVTCADFAKYVGSTFQIFPAHGRPTEVKLVRVREMPSASGARSTIRNPFRLVLRGAAGATLPQATYRVEHSGLGPMALFIVPTALSGEKPAYVAHFG